MNRRTQGEPLGQWDRIAAFARATEVYAESLEDPDLANVYFGKSLGLWQAAAILSAEDQPAASKRLRGPSPTCGSRRADRASRSVQPVASPAAAGAVGR